ncbi:MAG: LssY C-terminal domain-containing protein [Gammaproteobacteria bacterium]|nr:LssY C-terminal domain-containing protein [Gammaproteobacteria bacterium]
MKDDLAHKERVRFFIHITFIFFVSACANQPAMELIEDKPLPINLTRNQQQSQDDVTVHLAIPTAIQTEVYFNTQLDKFNIQPIWLKIENMSNVDYWLLPYAIDQSYYTADEVAFITSKHLEKHEFEQRRKFLRNNAMPFFQKANSTNEGYIYTTHKRGGRFVDVHLTGHNQATRLRFAVLLPTQRFDYEYSDLRERYSKLDQLPNFTAEEMRTYLRETLPCCTSNDSGSGEGDPINFILIGSGELAVSALSASGWQFTETVTIDSIRRMIGAAIEEKSFPSAPISALYALGRKQDVALQRGRSSINQRNHMRLWLAPFRCEDKPVWLGQISRDIGVKLTTKSKTLTTHIIDSNVDEAREYLLHSLLHSESVEKFSFVKGVGRATQDKPKRNLTDDPYITDGMRMIVWLSSKPIPPHHAKNLGWNASADPTLELINQSKLENLGETSLVKPLLEP